MERKHQDSKEMENTIYGAERNRKAKRADRNTVWTELK